jgi:tripartite ATP-independent transporter DctM subunit
MEILFLAILLILLVAALASGYPVAFALPGSAIITIVLASVSGMLFAGDSGAYFHQGDALQWFNAAITNFRGIYFEVERDTLIAIPLFIFMGLMLQRSKVAEDLLITMAQLFGPVPGGLGIAVVFVGALLAATTGIVGATVIAMGLISLPVMMRAKYNVPLATGTIAASGTLGQIIPPSIVLIILADQLSSATDRASTIRKAEFKDTTGSFSLPTEFDLTSTSAGEMFLGALIPGLILVGLYMAYILIVALVKKDSAPPVPFDGKYDLSFFKRVFIVLVPPLVLIFTVLGSIILGVATVNQAGAIGAAGAMIMAGYRLKEGEKHAFAPLMLVLASLVILGYMVTQFDINIKSIKTTEDAVVIAVAIMVVLVFLIGLGWSGWRAHKIEGTLNYVMTETAKTTSLVFIILLGAAMLTAAFRAFGGEELVKDFLNGLPGGFTTKFIVVMAVIFLLGFFLDFIEIAVVVVPIIAPILLADPSANITGVWLGVMIGVNMQTSFLTPPFGFALFYLRGVASKAVATIQMYKGVIPFIILQLVGLTIVGFYPSLVNFLPNRVSLSAETAPPPINPRLQVCIEEYLFSFYERDGDVLRSAIIKAKTLDFSYLPDRQKRAMTEAFQTSDQIFTQIAIVKKASSELAAYIPSYRPVHRKARDLQARARRLGVKIKEIEQRIKRLVRDGGNEKNIAAMTTDVTKLKAEKANFESQVPAKWKEARASYLKLSKAETNARRKYRRNVDDTYEPIPNLRKIISDAGKLASLEIQLRKLPGIVSSAKTEESIAKAILDVRAAEKLFGNIAAASSIKSKVSRARRALTKRKPDQAKALKELAIGLEIFAKEVVWRKRAAKDLLPGLIAYDDAIKNSIGLRQQERLTSEQAAEIAVCQSFHRDISLNF